jgi:hypothetical protein
MEYLMIKWNITFLLTQSLKQALQISFLFKILANFFNYLAYLAGKSYLILKIKLVEYVKISMHTLLVIWLKLNFKWYVLQIFIALLSLSLSGNTIALSAVTVKTIQGSAPYLTMDGGVTKIISEEGLLGIKLPDGRQYIAPGINAELYPDAIVDNSSGTTPIELSLETNTFASIQTLVPISSYPSIELNRLIREPYNYWFDIDGDRNPSATGNLIVQWKDANNKDITAEISSNPNKVLTACGSATPYQLTITSTYGELSTQYGVPQTTTFNEGSHTYYLTPNTNAGFACYAQPNLNYDNSSYGDESDIDGLNWVQKKGYKVTNINAVSENFPTTGSDGLYFYLLLAGISPEQAIMANGTTVTAESGSGVTLSLTSAQTPSWTGFPDEGGELALKILLKGPNKDSDDTRFTPSVFKLYSDSSHTHLLYSFKIERWYIGGLYIDSYDEAEKFCQNLGGGYRIPGIEDYTNSSLSLSSSSDGEMWTGGIPGRESPYYQRRLSYKSNNGWIGGIFNEWGEVGYGYKNSDWFSGNYFAHQYVMIDNGDGDGLKPSYFGVGSMGRISLGYVNAVACVAP